MIEAGWDKISYNKRSYDTARKILGVPANFILGGDKE
jgi:hypothetical protein